MQKILEIFNSIAAIPHCSHDTMKLKEYIIKKAQESDFEIKTDEAGNILCKKGKPKICLQSHYDMVCVGDAPNIKIYEENGFLKAKNSTLGADNGIGVALMLEAMNKYTNIECLFTADEEVGLLGAHAFNMPLESKYLLNLDSECDEEVIIGCAASFELEVFKKCEKIKTEKKYCYELKSKGFSGGHSGCDIAKRIPSAIVELFRFIAKNDLDVAFIEGGERTNSISVGARAIVFSDKQLKFCENFEIKGLEGENKMVFKNEDIMPFVAFKHGVFEYDENLKLPKLSANFSFMRTKDNVLSALFYARSDENKLFEDFDVYIKALFRDFEFKTKDRDEPWQSVESDFAHLVLNHLKKYKPSARLNAIHAGLECGVIKAKQPHLQCASIGPNIHFPHSVNEKCEIKSVELIDKALNDILDDICNK